MLKKLLSFMYDTALIVVMKKPKQIDIYVEMLRNDKIRLATEKSFILNDTYSDELLFDYIRQFSEDTPFYYVATVDTSADQGAFPTCNKHEIPRYKEMTTSRYICIDQEWGCYTSKIDLQEQIDFFGEIGLDFVFSPFLVLRDFFQDKIDSPDAALFVLLKEEAVVIAVFKEKRLLYADYVDMTLEAQSQTDMDLSLEEEAQLSDDVAQADDAESVDLEEIDLEGDLALENDLEDDDLDELEGIEDLDELDGLDTEENLEMRLEENLEKISTPQEVEKEAKEEEKTTQDFQRFSIIQNSLGVFYKDPRYESEFIENVYVADNVRVTNDFKSYLQEEMFLNVYLRSIELELEIAHLVKTELGLL